MIKDMKNLFLLTLFTVSFTVLADNPGEVVSEEPAEEAVVEETVESTPVETENDSSGDDTPSESEDGVVTLEKVTVTGSRIKRSQVEGASPLIVITKQDMKDNGYRNLTEALQSLPIANAATQNESLVNTFTPNANELDLRRFGPGRVLVLVNGRRMADYPFPYNNSSNFVNTGTIPAGLIDRIEILTSGSSAVYGSDAVTGVVNIITTTGKEYSEVDAFIGQTEHGEDNILDFTFTSGGFSGNHSWTIGANMYHIDPMYYNDRSDFNSWDDNPIWSDPSDPQYKSDAVFANYLMSLQSISGYDSTPRGYGEYGYDAFAANGYSCEDIYPVGFKWNKGDYGYTSPPYSYPGSYCVQDYSDDRETMINERDEYTVMGTYNYNFDNGVTLSARAFYYESESYLNSFSRWFRMSDVWTSTPHTTRQDSGFATSVVPDGAIGSNDFGRYRYTRTLGGMMGPNSRRESNYKEDVMDIFIGLNGVYDNGYEWQAGISTTEYNSVYESSPLTTAVYDWITGADRGDTTDISGFYKWRGDLYYNAAYAFGSGTYLNYANYYYSFMDTPAAQNHPCGVGTIVDPLTGSTYDACLAWDRAFSPIPDSAVGAFNAPEVTGAETSSTMIDYQVSGELDYQLPGGPIAFAAVFEYHEQDYLLAPDQRRIDSDNEVPGATIFINGSARQGGGDRSRTSVGFEFLLPVHPKLEVTAALRSDEYDDESSAVGRRQSAMLNFAYRPNDDFLLRGGAGESFRAPDMHYVYAGSSSYFTSVTDYFQCYATGVPSYQACDNSSTIKGRFQGNTLLEEESGENYYLGFVWDVSEGLSFTMDAFHVKLEGAVTNLDVQAIANREGYCTYGQDFATWLNDSNFAGVDCTQTLASIKRDAPGDLDTDGIGNYDEITTYNTNQSFEEFQGVDTTLRYNFSTESAGDFGFVLYNSNIISRKRKEDANSDTLELLDYYLYEPRSQQTATTTWRYDDWRVSLFMDRTGHTEQYYGEKGDPFITANLSVGYNYSADLSLRATVANIEDKMPEKDSAYGFPFFNRSYYSIFGRAVYLSASYRF